MAFLKSIEPISFAKVIAFITFILGLIVGVFFTLIGTAGRSFFNAKLMGLSLILISPFSIILDPIYFGILGFINGFIICFVYNAASQKIGRTRIKLSKKRDNYVLNNIGPLSLAKIYAVIEFFLGVIHGVLQLFSSNMKYSASPIVAFIYGPAGIIVWPVLNLIIGFVFALIGAIVYNFISKKIGGLSIRFNDVKGKKLLKNIDIASTAKITAVIALILGIIVSVFIIILILYNLTTILQENALHVSIIAIAIGIMIIVTCFVAGVTVFGTIIGVVVAFLYNIGAKHLGPINMEFSE